MVVGLLQPWTLYKRLVLSPGQREHFATLDGSFPFSER